MIRLSILAVCLLLGVSGFSQSDPVGAFNKHIAERWAGEYTRVGQYRVRGTAMLLGETFPASVVFGKSQRTDNAARLMYDLNEQKLLFAAGNELIAPEGQVSQFTIQIPPTMGGGSLTFKSADQFGNPKGLAFLSELATAESVVFLKGYKVKLVADPTNEMAKDYKMFEQYAEYYFYIPATREIKSVKLNKKKVSGVLNSIKGLEDKVKATNFDLGTENGIINFIASL